MNVSHNVTYEPYFGLVFEYANSALKGILIGPWHSVDQICASWCRKPALGGWSCGTKCHFIDDGSNEVNWL